MTDAPAITTGLGVQIEEGPRPSITREHYTLPDGSRAFRGFVVLTPAGSIAWATFRPEQADAEAAYRSWNPLIDMHPTSWKAVPVEITLWPEPLSFAFEQ